MMELWIDLKRQSFTEENIGTKDEDTWSYMLFKQSKFKKQS